MAAILASNAVQSSSSAIAAQIASTSSISIEQGAGSDQYGCERARSRPSSTARIVGIDRLFFDWRGGRIPQDEAYADPAFDPLRAALDGRQRALTHDYWSDPAPCSMLTGEVEAIWAAIADQDDWTPFDAKIAAIRRMGDAMTQDAPA